MRSSSEGKLAEALALRGRSSNRKGIGDHGRLKSKSGFRDLKKNQCALCKELGTGRLIIQSPKVRRSQRLRQISHRQLVLMPVLYRRMDRTQTHRYSFSLLLLLLLVTQVILSRSQIQELSIMCARTGTDFLALRSQMDVSLSWVMIIHVI